MIVDVSWDGVKLATGAQAREEGNGWFIELEQPMPVGTRLQLDGEAQATVRVARVHEGLGAGMLVNAEGAVAHAPRANAKADAKADAKPDAKTDAHAEPSVIVAADAGKATENDAHASGDDAADEGTNGAANGAAKRDRRRRRKPTGA
jgi:hypothetical protein